MMQSFRLDERTSREDATIGILADTHDNMPAIEKAVDVFNEREVDMVLHAGDIVSPFTADAFSKLHCDMILIYGNNDGDKPYLPERFRNIGVFHTDPYIEEIYGARIAMTHHPEIVDALATKYDVVIYGHTHEREIKREDALIINPGECCGYLTGVKSVALLHLGKMEAELVEW